MTPTQASVLDSCAISSAAARKGSALKGVLLVVLGNFVLAWVYRLPALRINPSGGFMDITFP